MAVASTTIGWRNIVADVPAILEQKRRIDSMAKASYSSQGVIGGDEPAVGTRNPPVAEVSPELVIKQTPDIFVEIFASRRVKLGAAGGLTLVEVVQHRDK